MLSVAKFKAMITAFFPELPKEIQDRVEAVQTERLW